MTKALGIYKMSSKKSNLGLIDLQKPHTCEFCHKNFARESTLISHVCEQKRRWQNQKCSYVQSAYLAYKQFHSSCHPLRQTQPPTYQEFSSSNYYGAFVKFGNWCQQQQVQEYQQFVAWLLNNNLPLDNWCDHTAYQLFLQQLLNQESSEQAIKRSLATIFEWSWTTGQSHSKFFQLAHPNVLLNWILQGRISVWLIYNCESALVFLGKCTSEQLQMLNNHAPMHKWKIKFLRNSSECLAIKQTLAQVFDPPI
jgi:hypothetical protein